MTRLPEKARSEFVTPWNSGGLGELETSRMFQIASAAARSGVLRLVSEGNARTVPARSPTRGSGLGLVVAAVARLAGAGPRSPPPPEDDAHPAAQSAPISNAAE